jgi:ligand-binding sensor domain-containing protein
MNFQTEGNVMIKTFALLFTLLLSTILSAQEAINWKVMTDMKNVYDAVDASSGIWAATKGGAFFYSSAHNSFKTFNKSEGFQGSFFTSVAIDKYGNIWFGSQNGIIDVYNPETNTVNSVLDIYNSDRSQKQINELKVKGDTIIASTDFGISLIDSKSFLFFDTFFKLGTMQSNSKVKSSSLFVLFYAATENGLAVQKRGTVNLSAPESWIVYTNLNGLPSKNVLKVVEYKNQILAVTDKGLSKFENDTWIPFIPQLTNKSISDVLSEGDSLFILSGDTIKVFANNLLTVKTQLLSTVRKLVYSSKGLLGISSQGILKVETGEIIFPNGPSANQFPSIAVDPDGHLWSASGKNNRGVGFYEYDGTEWRNYDMSNTTALTTNDFYNIYAAPDNTIYAGSWGGGFLSIKDGNIKRFDANNTEMQGQSGSPKYLVITGFATDSKNNTWILNYASNNRKNLSVLTPDSAWYHFVHPSTPTVPSEQYYNLVIDQYDTKWFYSLNSAKPGLYYFNENKTYEDDADDRYGLLDDGSGLLSISISSIVLDKRGDIWVGTNSGVNIISGQGTILSSSSQNPPLRITSVFSLRQQAITCMAVDPLNRKWIGTNQGLLLVSSDGTSLYETYTAGNSPLPADKIVSLAVDDATGKIYAGTDDGIVSFETTAKKAVDAFTELFIYPNPYKLNNSSGRLTIDGLIKDADIKVLTINGKLIKEFSSPGGRIAYWDGRDTAGKLVASGVYLIIAFDKEGNNIKTAKVAVLRQ